jgi:ribose transport system substrate-binding protein
MNRKTVKLVGAVLLLLTSSAACGSDDDEPSPVAASATSATSAASAAAETTAASPESSPTSAAGAATETTAASPESSPTSAAGETSSPSETSAATETSAAAPDKAYNLAFVQGVAGDVFYITMQCGIEAEAKAAGATVKTQGAAKFDPTLQRPVVQSVVASKPDALIIAPTDVSAMQQPIAEAKSQGIKVILVDTTLKDPSVAESAIASDNLGGGKAAFEAIQKLVPGGGKVLGVGTQPGVSTTDARDKGFGDAAKGDSKFEYLGVQYSQNEPRRPQRS